MNLLLLGALVAAASPAAGVDFDSEIVPILTKAGCNAAACHGSAAGRGGFKLSLFGGEPAWDYDEIVHRLEGRRINLAHPDESLLLLKPTQQLDHEGGLRFDLDAPQAITLQSWISQGARRLETRRLAALQVDPAEAIIPGPGGRLQISSVAVFEDGSRRDVTAAAVYSSADPAAVEVDADGNCVIHRRGRHAVVVRFLSQVKTVLITVPLSEVAVDLSQAPRHNWVDDEVLQMLGTLRLPPSPQADDATILRRLRLDLTGRLPQLDEVRDYLADQDPDKYRRLVDRLLDSDQFTQYWTYKLATLLRIQAQPNEPAGARAFHQWVYQQLRAGDGWDRMAFALLTAEGDTHEHGPANFYRVVGDARAQAEYVSELFMGVRLRCANCHNHPLDRWTQDDYHGLAAIFAGIERGRHIRNRTRGEVIHPETGEAAVARIPGARFLDPDQDGRQALADWLTHGDNPYFAKALVNRLWKAMMGAGLIEPPDDVRGTNPASHPALLERLAEDFAAHQFDIRHTLRLVANSAAYRRDRRATEMNGVDTRFYSHALTRQLEPEVLADAICDVTGVPEQYGEEPSGTRAVALFNPRTPSESLDILGRCDRDDSCETGGAAATGLTTKLHLINGPLINRKLSQSSGRLDTLIKAGRTTDEVVEQFYLCGLARYPSQAERSFWQQQLAGGTTEQQREQLEDFVWSLLNSREFLTK